MTIEVTKAVDFKKISQEVKADLIKNFERAMDTAATEIVERSFGGRDVNNKAFKKLTPAYRNYKIRKTHQTGIANMHLTGKMLAAITSKITETASGLLGRIFFSSAQETAKAQGNLKTREFFGLSEAQVNKIKETIKG